MELFYQEKIKNHQRFIDILEGLKIKEKYSIPVIVYQEIQKINQKIQKAINQLKDEK